MDIKNIKKEWNSKLMDILKAFIEICETYKLRYYCCGGTAIGAVRHNGMIPWDDDIDVMMPRPDYERLLQIAQEKQFGKYEIITPYNNDDYPLYFAKISDSTTTIVEERERPCVIGLYVDIFPIDATDDDNKKAEQTKKHYTKLINRLNAVSTRNTFCEYIGLLKDRKEWGRFAIKTLAFFFRMPIRRRLLRKMDAISHRYDYEIANNVAVHTGSYGLKEIFPKEWLGRGCIHKFEDIEVVMPEKYDIYLRHFFGDYMQLPPKEQRIEKHNRAYFNLNERMTLEDIRQFLA
ncbi:MAG: LicD family protein [Prevotella sp.]|nr:LicD family protein [Prevotella sp.]